MGDSNDTVISVSDLPLKFTVKYLGSHPSKGLWGMKFTRKPVDNLVSQARNMPPNVILPIVIFNVSEEGVEFVDRTSKKIKEEPTKFSVENISYGVQDLVYTRVFSMIVVTDDNLNNGVPFECHSFLCDSRNEARKITYALAAVFQDYGRKIKQKNGERPIKKFAIDLRTPEQQAEGVEEESDV
ncbi:low density lipoprotein receptor adapter protein 1-A [Diorhabda carinulata]|uniref:low density lipoprotein receptor adapter protein 1-A n=1 Tax=Diorhabda carinulata TaxID=1163345 RepID=UPI0025A17BD4|nr:low density lipoprotein receptor adapter protein 1-A [Diorhabda carinulata]